MLEIDQKAENSGEVSDVTVDQLKPQSHCNLNCHRQAPLHDQQATWPRHLATNKDSSGKSAESYVPERASSEQYVDQNWMQQFKAKTGEEDHQNIKATSPNAYVIPPVDSSILTTPVFERLSQYVRHCERIWFFGQGLTRLSCHAMSIAPLWSPSYVSLIRGTVSNSLRRLKLRHGSTYLHSGLRCLSSKSDIHQVPDFAFAFDIDGVLLRSSAAIPGASEALKYLQKSSIPFILLTNGGGKTEAVRVADMSEKLSLPLSESLIVQSHTPFAELAQRTLDTESSSSAFYDSPSLADKTVLVLGGDHDKCRHVAQTYGFKNVITPGDIYASYPEISPFSHVFKSYYSQFAKPLPRPINPENPTNSLKIHAVFVYNDPRDWALDIQLVVDLLLSHQGILGTHSDKNGDSNLQNHGYQQDGQPPLYFSNPDLLWAAAYHLPRFGQGGFREALEGVWAAVTNKQATLKKFIIGKPHAETYEFAERKLLKHRDSLFSNHPDTGTLRRVYMVGDNPESDIAGANNYKSAMGTEWKSLLVRTGVHVDREGMKPAHEPKVIVDDVSEAVRWALRDSAWHEDLD